ncbi:hypothetical protein LPJ78_005294 [Coemansia sp. RSA 989]|nr:hypothetical protein LPJ78_005294 [Coemansia sp. RSA 989]KAJ2667843.1 hypothetical protein IWW42_005648 [Coemansia sp. RSA 1085]
MIRHPPSWTTVTQKDVDDLAAKHHQLLASIKEGNLQGPHASQAADNAAAPRSEPVDGFDVQRRQRRELTLAQRLGLDQ